ncbi:class I adenylate-forming enzyme family protein [Streptomyces sp. NPDC055210]
MNVVTRIEHLAARNGWAARPAYHVPDGTWTHARVHDLAARCATVLAARGVRRGDRVLLALPDGVTWVAAFLAVARLGAVAVLVNPRLTAEDHAYAAADSGAVLAVGEEPLRDRFAAWLDAAELLRAAGRAPCAATADCQAGDHLYIQYTSGTTSRPKAVPHRHGDLEAYCAASGRFLLGVGADDVLLSVSKLFFAYGLDNSLAFPLFSGASAVLTPQPFDAGVTADAVRRHGVTLLFTVPNASVKLLRTGTREDLGTVRAVVSAGEALDPGLRRRLSDACGAPVLNQLGSTEAGQAYCSNTVRHDAPGTVGFPVAGFGLEVRDTAGRPVPEGEAGELWIRGQTLTGGYLNAPEQTAASFASGWFNTRDLVRAGHDGTYTYLGRADDIEVVGGINVSPYEIETVLREHPDVRDVGVVALRTPAGDSQLAAFVVPAVDADPAALRTQVVALARDRLAAFKVPRAVRVMAELPRTPSGKLRRFVLRGEQAP